MIAAQVVQHGAMLTVEGPMTRWERITDLPLTMIGFRLALALSPLFALLPLAARSDDAKRKRK